MSSPLSWHQRRRLAILTSGFALSLSGWIVIGPLVEAYQAKLNELSLATTSLPAEPHFRPTFPELNADLVRLKNELATKRRSFPIAENVSTFLMELEALASTQVAIRHFYPTKLAPLTLPKSRAKTGISVSEQQIEMEAVGPFASLHSLLSRFETSAHPVGIRGVLLSQAPGSRHGAPEQLSLKVKLSAFLLDHPAPEATVLGDLSQQLLEAQTGTGVANPFAQLGLEPLPALPVLPRPIVVPSKPSAPIEKFNLNELAPWRLQGIMVGPDERAIVQKAGQLSQVVRINEELDGWKVLGIEKRAIELSKGGQNARLSLPELLP